MAAINKMTLECHWLDDGSKTGAMLFRLFAAPYTQLPQQARLAFTSLVRIPPDTELDGACFLARTANYHEVGPCASLSADDAGLLWTFTIPELSHRPNHCTDGPKSAFIILPDGETIDVVPGDFNKATSAAPTPPRPIVSSEIGTSARPMLGVLPQVQRAEIADWSDIAPKKLQLSAEPPVTQDVKGLFERLFPDETNPFSGTDGDISLIFAPAPSSLKEQEYGYALHFAPAEIRVEASDEAIFLALITLAQIWRANRLNSGHFGFPCRGTIVDWPEQDWRGMHLDVSRQFYEKQAILDFLDILAWHKINRFHWHLTDDEGWRLESLAYPTLTHAGAWRGYGLPLKPQHGSGAEPYGGFYSRSDISEIITHAQTLNIEIIPEIDVPGHCHAALMSVPELLDPSAVLGGASVQGYVNNALNPGLAASWRFLETIFGEVSDLFPGRYVHIGGDEVAEGAWSGSRSAISWARAKGFVDGAGKPDSMAMQSVMLRFVSDRLTACGKISVAWEEAAKGSGLSPENAILMAWMHADNGPRLTADGYRVIMCPGEAYYLDMAQSDDWDEPGLSWAGTSSPKQTYQFDPLSDFKGGTDALVGIQGCIWSENLTSRSLFNHMVFPRLCAIAERGWSNPESLDWQSFQHRQPLMPLMPDGKAS